MDNSTGLRASAEVTTAAGVPEGEEGAAQANESAASQAAAGATGSIKDEAEARGSAMEYAVGSEPGHAQQAAMD